MLPWCETIVLIFQNDYCYNSRFFQVSILVKFVWRPLPAVALWFDNAASDETVVTLRTSVVTLCCKKTFAKYVTHAGRLEAIVLRFDMR